MDLCVTSEHEELRERVRRFAEEVIAPAVPSTEKLVFPKRVYREMGRRGFLSIMTPISYGGMGKGIREHCIVLEEISKVSMGCTPGTHPMNQLMIYNFGSEAQKKKYLPKLASGRLLSGIAISEEAGSSSFKNMATVAKRSGDSYILNGEKMHITRGGDVDVLSLLAITDNGPTIFLVEKGTPGLAATEKLDALGFRAAPNYRMTLKDCVILQEQRLGQEGQALEIFNSTWNLTRVGNSSVFIGQARAALDYLESYIKQRRVGESYIADFQGVRWIIAEHETKLEAVTQLRNKALLLLEKGADSMKEVTMAKLMATEVALNILSDAVRLAGGFGTYKKCPLERFLRDAKAFELAGGAPEILKNLIAKRILG